MDSQRVTRFPMSKGEIIRINQPAGWSIKAHTGRFWITQSNHHEDIFLDAGNVFVAKSDGILIAEAMNHALLSLTGPNPTRVPARPVRAGFAGVVQGA